MFEKEVGLTEDLSKILTELTQLSKAENAKVALKARQVSIKAKVALKARQVRMNAKVALKA